MLTLYCTAVHFKIIKRLKTIFVIIGRTEIVKMFVRKKKISKIRTDFIQEETLVRRAAMRPQKFRQTQDIFPPYFVQLIVLFQHFHFVSFRTSGL